MKINLNKRWIAKALTWRILGAFGTTLLFWIYTGKFEFTLCLILFSDIILKLSLYYGHEWIWEKLHWWK